MKNRLTGRDLFGKPIRTRRLRYEAALEKVDKRSLATRAARVRWLSEIIPKNLGLFITLETFYVSKEAKSSFVYGNFVATIVLAASFIEHWFIANLARRGFEREAARGLGACLKVARARKLVDPLLLDKVDRLRLIRNPFVHLKELDHQYGIGQRFLKLRKLPEEVLEQDAQEALIAMYGVAIHAFGRY